MGERHSCTRQYGRKNRPLPDRRVENAKDPQTNQPQMARNGYTGLQHHIDCEDNQRQS
ncbi:MAG: hypothetical protein ABR909_12575 [Candidatus Bathyarchaeia archaeon]